MTFFDGYLTLDLDLAEVFRGIRICWRFFALKDFLRYKPLKNVWADSPTAVRFRVKGNGGNSLQASSYFTGQFVLRRGSYRSEHGAATVQVVLDCAERGGKRGLAARGPFHRPRQLQQEHW